MSLDDKYKKIFSKNLNYYMNLSNKTQTDIINDLNINKSAISSWCNGTRLPRMNKVQELANYFGIHFSKLIEEKSEQNQFEFIAEDDAMFPLLDIGDIALVSQQNNIEDGATHLIVLDNKRTIRKIILSDDKSYYKLVAMNACYKPIDIHSNEIDKIKILGKVIKIENRSAFK